MTKFDEFGLPEPTKYPQMPKVIKMNERIKTLIKAAGGVSHDEDGRELTPMLAGSSLEKFAESLIRECIHRIEGCAVAPEDDEFVKGYNKGVSKVSSQVKHHFGVKE